MMLQTKMYITYMQQLDKVLFLPWTESFWIFQYKSSTAFIKKVCYVGEYLTSLIFTKTV